MRPFYLIPAALVCCAVAPAAHAAELRLVRNCVLQPASGAPSVGLVGTGFTPGGRYEVLVDGRPVAGGSGVVPPDGTVGGLLPLPRLPAAAIERRHRIAVRDVSGTPTTPVYVTRTAAAFAPASGDPATLRVRFRVSGFGPDGGEPDVFAHYVRPDGRHARTVRLGRATGPCGRIARTRLRRLFPLRPSAGRWRLQLDTRRTYRRAPIGPFVRFAVRVRTSGR